MSEIKKYSIHLALLFLLLLIKLVVVPVLGWQDTLLFDINQGEKRLVKIKRVLGEEENVTLINDKLILALDNAEQLFFSMQKESKFKLSQQQMIESLVSTHKVKLVDFGWNVVSPLSEIKATKYTVEMKFDGELTDIIAMLVSFEAHTPWIEIEDFFIPTRNADDAKVYINGARVSINLYMLNYPKNNEFVTSSSLAGMVSLNKMFSYQSSSRGVS